VVGVQATTGNRERETKRESRVREGNNLQQKTGREPCIPAQFYEN
jgi:hypothetical protein